MKASEGKKTCLLFVNARYLNWASNGKEWSYIYGGTSSKGVKGNCVLGYKEAKNDLSYQHFCYCNASFFSAFVVVIIIFFYVALVVIQWKQAMYLTFYIRGWCWNMMMNSSGLNCS
jgi:hypothetical protein